MNMQTHLSSGQVPNQAATQMPGLSKQNGNSLSAQMQSLGGHSSNMDKERKLIHQKICDFLVQRQQPTHEIPQGRLWDLGKRLEERLFKDAHTKEEYINLNTLENRLHVLIKQMPLSNRRDQFPQHISSSSVGTMIPTPGMPQSSNTNLMITSSLNTSMMTPGAESIASTMANTGSFLPTTNGPVGVHSGAFNPSDGSFANGYQQSSSNFSINSGGNNIMSSMGGQRMTSQMIPTPGFNSNTDNNNSSSINNGNNNNIINHNYANLDGVGISNVESTMLSQPMLPKQQVGGQNSRILHNLGSHMSGGIRSGLLQKSFGFSNGSLNGMGMGKSLHVNARGNSEGLLPNTFGGNSAKPLQHGTQHPQPLVQGDEYGIGTADSSGSGNFYVSPTSAGTTINNQNSNLVSLQSISKTNSPLMANHTNLHAVQQATSMKPQINDQEKMDYQSSNLLQETLSQSHQLQPHHFQQQQFLQHQRHPKMQTHQHQLKNNAFVQSQLMSDISSQIKLEPGMEGNNDPRLSQVSRELQLSDMQNHFQQNCVEDHSGSTHLLSFPSGQQEFCSPLSQASHQMPLFHSNLMASDSQNDFSCLPMGGQSDAVLQNQWHSNSQFEPQAPGNLSHEQNVLAEFDPRMPKKDDGQRNGLSSEISIINRTVPTKSPELPSSSRSLNASGNLNREKDFANQKRWLLFLMHARRCGFPQGKCPEKHCLHVQKLFRHMEQCKADNCLHPRCRSTKSLVEHHRHCKDSSCPVCIPVKKFVLLQMKRTCSHPDSGMKSIANGTLKSYGIRETASGSTLKTNPPYVETSEHLQPSKKRMKIEQPSHSLPSESESSVLPPPSICESQAVALHNIQLVEQPYDVCMTMKSEDTEVKIENPANSGQIIEMKENIDDNYVHRPQGDGIIINDSSGFSNQASIKIEKDVDNAKQANATLPSENANGTKSGKPKIKGVSLTELFTPEQVRAHITGLRQWIGQSKAKAEKNQAMENSMSENSCQLCAVEKLTFEPPPIYCTSCGGRIKRNAMYHTIGSGDTRHYFCIPCYNDARGDTIVVDGTTILKARLEKKKNDEETEEWWVQCDKCECWQHQICALFNGRRNDGGQAEYTCPNCFIAEVENGERKPLPQNAVLGAKDLPRTILSDQIEHRLAKRLKQEKQDRARLQGKSIDEVPGADGLVVRVVSSVDKKLEVKQRFLEIFQEQNYPTEFPYKSKAILLFQKIEGVEVCLFGMYVQEFGSECQQPNHRRVYLSYLDSVKYFRPEVKSVTGEALRTFVYHEILIGYLEYCKKRGFTSCYIWACPPLKGEDYILYCHPEIQKTPKSDKLREWYLAMLKKAAKESIVVGLTNLYDHFFVTTGECKAKVTAARLPYFEGDYWPGAAEDMLFQIQQEEDGRKQHKKGTTKKTITKRALKASGQTDLSGNASKDLLLMHKLGETICPMKEDFIMVHLQHACNHCCILMVSGNRWACKQCKNFQLCDKCYEAEQKLDEREKHPTNQKEKHTLHPIEINDVPLDTKDKDEILESEFFDTRQAFLSLCQGNHYQYDTLRRAKHSSMMVLYHLHNPTAPAFVTTCNMCFLDIESGQGWRCEICPEYDVCNSCYHKDGGIDHPHKLTNHPSTADRDAQSKEARQQRVSQLRKMLDLLVHASQCRALLCNYPNCRRVKGLFRHGIQCKTRASGGCVLCKKMWYILQLHARACKESECHVPRCRDLKEHLRRLQQQSESRRRAAVMEMMRQRAAEVAGNAG